jgi:(S)-2-hydroxyglutarate dehydrogenase
VHLTRATDDSVEAGPNAVLALKREGYTWGHVSFGDVASMLGYGGFWRMAKKHYRMGLFEVQRSLVKAEFVRAVQTLVPAVRDADLVPGRAGVRAQAVEPDGSLVDDFRFVECEAMLHVLNAPSPAATASLAIGEHIATVASKIFR